MLKKEIEEMEQSSSSSFSQSNQRVPLKSTNFNFQKGLDQIPGTETASYTRLHGFVWSG